MRELNMKDEIKNHLLSFQILSFVMEVSSKN